jgi:hypothetical protein
MTNQDGIIKALETLIKHSNELKERKQDATSMGNTLDLHQHHLEMHEHQLNLLCGSVMTLSQELIKLKSSNEITFGVN